LIIQIDGVADLISAQPEVSSEGLLDSLSSVLFSGGRSPIGYQINGEEVAIDPLETKLQKGLGEKDVLNLLTEPLGDALTRQIEEMSKALSDSEGQLLNIGEGLTKEDSSDSLEKLSECLVDLKGMAEALGQLLEVFNIVDGEDGEIEAALRGLSSAFQRIEEGLKQNKVVELADYIEHDFTLVLSKVRGALPEIASQVRKGLESIQ
jgi:hypothetical protein